MPAPPCNPSDLRKQAALARRSDAANLACGRDLVPDPNADNGDEDDFKFPDPADPTSSEVLSFAAQFTKGMGHNSLGEVSPRSQYRALLNAVTAPSPPSEFEAIPRGPQPAIGPAPDPSMEIRLPPMLRRYVNPQSGIAFTLEAPDPPQAAVFARGALTPERFPVAPNLSSDEAAAELAENYEMAMLRDVPFNDFEADTENPQVLDAAASLSAFADFRGPKVPNDIGFAAVTPQTLFRGGNYFRNPQEQINGGELVGPYVSQLLLIGSAIEEGGGPPRQFSAEEDSVDTSGQQVIPPGSSTGLVVSRKEGRIQFGLITIDQRVRAVRDGRDFLVDYKPWLAVQNGFVPEPRNEFLPTTGPNADPNGGLRFVYNGRQLANWVHFDQTYQAYYAAAFLLLGMAGRAAQLKTTLFGVGNPYNPPQAGRGVPGSANQEGFGTFGQGHLLALLGQIDQRALEAIWYQKWFVQRRLRPEAMAGRVHNTVQREVDRDRYNLSKDLLDSDHGLKLLERVSRFNAERGSGKEQTFLLAQAFPEGSPLHPSYGAGHAVEAGAGATILKAFFHEDLILTDAFDGPPPPGVTKQPALIASADGKTLIDYEGAGRNTPLPLWQEVNKMASNIGVGRNIAGVHFRTDYAASLRMGEYVAVGLLQEQAANFNEDQFFEVTLFDLRVIRIGPSGITVVRTRPVPVPS